MFFFVRFQLYIYIFVLHCVMCSALSSIVNQTSFVFYFPGFQLYRLLWIKYICVLLCCVFSSTVHCGSNFVNILFSCISAVSSVVDQTSSAPTETPLTNTPPTTYLVPIMGGPGGQGMRI